MSSRPFGAKRFVSKRPAGKAARRARCARLPVNHVEVEVQIYVGRVRDVDRLDLAGTAEVHVHVQGVLAGDRAVLVTRVKLMRGTPECRAKKCDASQL